MRLDLGGFMTERDLSRILAIILVVGHVGLFAYAFIILSQGGRADVLGTMQMVLMGTPLLAIAVAAFTAVNNHKGSTEPAEATQIFLNIFVCVALIVVMTFFYTQLLFANGMDTEVVKVAVGVVETAFGGFMAVLRKRLFPDG